MINIDKPTFAGYIDKLAAVAGMDISSYADLIEAVYKRIDFFHEAGCRITDHALAAHVPYEDATKRKLTRYSKRR